jgi:long-chain fatty acid transport protein
MGVATSWGFDSVYLNPAGLSEAPSRQVVIGYRYANLRLTMNGRRTDTPRSSSIIYGVVLPLNMRGALKDRLSLGVGVEVPRNALVRAYTPKIGDPVFALLESRSDVIGIQVAAGLRLSEEWRVGLGILALGSLTGKIDVDVDPVGRFVTQGEQNIVAGYAMIAGARYIDTSGWRAGLTFRSASAARFDYQITSDLADSLPVGLPPLQILGVAQYDPLTVAAEWATFLRPGWQVGVGLDYKRWSAFPRPAENPVVGGPAPAAPKFHDTVVPRTSLEVTSKKGNTHLTGRLGYHFAMTPAPHMTGEHSLLDNHRHVFGAGFGIAWPGTRLPFHLDLWGQFHSLVPRNHTKRASEFGDPTTIPFDSIRSAGRIVAGGAVLGVDI